MQILTNQIRNKVAGTILRAVYKAEPSVKVWYDWMERQAEAIKAKQPQEKTYEQKYVELLEELARKNQRSVELERHYFVDNSAMFGNSSTGWV